MNRVAGRRAALAAVVLLALFALSPVPTTSGQVKDEAQKVVSVEGITEYKLPNGVRYLLFPDPSSSTVTVNMTVLVGSRHEGYGEAGMAHLLEHMLFKGTPTFPNIDRALQEHGAGRSANGTTWVDRTNYYETMPATDKNLEFGIRLEADRLLNSFVKREDLVKEMTVVRNEFEQGENSPEYILSQRMMGLAFEWHNYGKSTIGNRADIERVPIDRLQAFYKKHYQPDNIVLIVAGKFDEKKAIQYIGKYFAPLKRPQRKLEQTYTEEPPQDGERSVTLRRVGKVPVVGLIYHIPAASHPDYAALDVLNTILVAEPRGRLYKALVESKMAAAVSGSAYGWHDPGILEYQATVNPKVKPEDVRDKMIEVVEGLAQSKVTDAEVARAKRKILADRERALAKSSRIAIELSEWVGAGDWRLLFLHRDRVEKVTPKAVEAAAAKYLRQTNRTVGMFLPTGQVTRTPIPASDTVAALKDYKGGKGSAVGEAFDPTYQNIDARTRRVTLPGGMKLSLLPKKTRGETVSGLLVLNMGSEKTLLGKTTAAAYVGDLMMRGTKKYTREQLEDELDVLGATLSAGSTAGAVSFRFEAKRDTLKALLDILGEVARNPTFPADEFGILQRAARQELEKALTDPDELASEALRRHLNPYPKGSIHYVPTIAEAVERLEALTRDQVAELYTKLVGSQNGELVIVGDFDADAATKQITALLDGWKAQEPYQRIAKKADFKVPGGRKEIVTPDKENAVYLAGYYFPMADTAPDYMGLVIGNYIMGGSGFNARVTNRLREKEGLCYSAYSSFSVDTLDKYGSLRLYASANPENVPKVNKGMHEELAKLLGDGITEKELAESKVGYLQERKVARSSDRGIVSVLYAAQHLNRPLSFYEDLEKRVSALTVDEVNRALRAHVTPNRLYVIEAGDFKKGKGK